MRRLEIKTKMDRVNKKLSLLLMDGDHIIERVMVSFNPPKDFRDRMKDAQIKLRDKMRDILNEDIDDAQGK